MPFLNCVAKCDQMQLKEILPRLCSDVSMAKMDTLKEFHVEWKHVNMEDHIPSEFENLLLKQMCYRASKGLQLQCAREYWGSPELAPRATELFKLNEEQLKHLPTDNIATERYLAKFGYLASISAVHSNFRFKAKRIRDDLLFDEGNLTAESLDLKNRQILKQLKDMEIRWTAEQEVEKRAYIKKNLENQKRINCYMNEILNQCKSHGGPIGTVNDLKTLVRKTKKKEDLHKHLRHEVIFRRQMQPNDHRLRPHLYKVNKMSTDSLLQNLTILLTNEGSDESCSTVDFPTEQEMIDSISSIETSVTETQDDCEMNFHYLQPLAVVWGEENEEPSASKWYLGFFISGTSQKGCIMVDHLSGAESEWVRPRREEVLEVYLDQIIPVSIRGDWVIVNAGTDRSTSMKYVVENWQEVNEKKRLLEMN